jgi:hypothetical protein
MFQTIKMIALNICLIFILISSTACANKEVDNLQGENTMAAKTIEEVLKKHTEDLMSIPGVVGTAQGLCDNKPCIKVFVIKKTPDLDQKIPANLEGYPVVMEETGKIRALPENQ